jgi:hypothetical protein
MEDKPISPIEIVKLPLEVLGGKGISLQSDHVSTSFFESASDPCQWHEKDEVWVIESGYNWPFRHWLADKVAVHVRFEYNGCDVNNAWLTLSSTSFIKWYNDKASLDEYDYNHLDARIFRRYNNVDARDVAEAMRKLFESEPRRREERLPNLPTGPKRGRAL